MNKRKFIFALVLSILVCIINVILLISTINEFLLFKREVIDNDYLLIKQENRYIQLMINYAMLSFGGSLLLFSILYKGFNYENRKVNKIVNAIGILVIFVLNFIVELKGFWFIIIGLSIILTFDCIFIFIKELFKSQNYIVK